MFIYVPLCFFDQKFESRFTKQMSNINRAKNHRHFQNFCQQNSLPTISRNTVENYEVYFSAAHRTPEQWSKCQGR
ncbi:MAG: hypothetical protein EBV40_05910 [Actinobacteria bacterium]|nr:hypothetical protein [Actinomycetota bacterium]